MPRRVRSGCEEGCVLCGSSATSTRTRKVPLTLTCTHFHSLLHSHIHTHSNIRSSSLASHSHSLSHSRLPTLTFAHPQSHHVHTRPYSLTHPSPLRTITTYPQRPLPELDQDVVDVGAVSLMVMCIQDPEVHMHTHTRTCTHMQHT